MPERTCYSLRCGYVTSEAVKACPKCGKPMRTSGQVRLLGAIQLLLGLFLVVFMGVITWNVAPMLLNPGQEGAGSKFTGTSQQSALILALFGTIIAFGLGSSVSGLWQLATARRNKWIIFLVFGVGLVLIVVVAVLNQTFGR